MQDTTLQEPPLTGVRFATEEDQQAVAGIDFSAARPSALAQAARPPSSQRASSQDLSHALDLADLQSNRPSPNPEVTALLERKRQEHERVRKAQQEVFEAQMRELEARQAAEEAQLLSATSNSSHSPVSQSPSESGHPGAGLKHGGNVNTSNSDRLMPNFNLLPSASAPTTPPPRSPSQLGSQEDNTDGSSNGSNDQAKQAYDRMTRSDFLARPTLTDSADGQLRHHHQQHPHSSQWMPHHTVTAPTSPIAQFGAPGSGTLRDRSYHQQQPQQNHHLHQQQQQRQYPKSQPVSRRHSGEDLQAEHAMDANGLANGFEKMQIHGNNMRSASSANLRDVKSSGPPGTEAAMLGSFLFDDELDAELNNPSFSGKYLAMTDEDKFPILVKSDGRAGMTSLSAASAALDLAPLSQTPPRSSGFMMHANSRTSEWPQFDQAGQQQQQQQSQHSQQNPQRSSRGFEMNDPLGAGYNVNLAHSHHQPSLSPSQSRQPSPVASRKASLAVPTAPGSPVDLLSQPKRASLNLPPPQSQGGPFGADFNGGSRYLSYSSGPGPKDMYSQQDLGRSYMSSSHQRVSPGRGENGYNYGSRVASRGSMAGFQQQPKRADDMNRFAGLHLEDLQGDMASLCKDQHGCRFLQRKLEEGNAQHRDMIFAEVYPHFAELMVDSFGNYLAQRLLEFSSDEQKDILIASVHDDLVNISLNIHGTRAIQRLIDHLTTPRQIQALVSALNGHVVALIKDLNGNHVIQKCLNSLKPEDNQFIYNAVTANCVEVATHRHGCCVLQRCIDHASESQRIQLVTEITYQCLTLVQDPFSNYVVQYCLEFDRRFVEAIIRQFQGNVCALSCHKFSSNVIEKCIRVADNDGRRIIIAEMLDRGRLERLVKDNFANYVVQTACDFAEPVQRDQLVQQIRPLLPQIRNTPYGKRIAARIQRMPQANNRFMGYPMSGGFAYGPPPPPPPQLGFGPNGPLMDAFQHQRGFPTQATQLPPAAAFMPYPSGGGAADFGHHPMPQAAGGPSYGAGPPFL